MIAFIKPGDMTNYFALKSSFYLKIIKAATEEKGIDEMAKKLIDGLEAIIRMKSPYLSEYQAIVYEASRYSPGSDFDQLFTENEFDGAIRKLREKGTL